MDAFARTDLKTGEDRDSMPFALLAKGVDRTGVIVIRDRQDLYLVPGCAFHYGPNVIALTQAMRLTTKLL